MIWDSDFVTSGLHLLVVATIAYAATRFFLNRHRLDLKISGYGFGLFFGALAGVGLLHLLDLVFVHLLLRPVLGPIGSLQSFLANNHDTTALLSVAIIGLSLIVASMSVRRLISVVDDRERLLRAVFDNVPIGLTMKSRDRRLLLFNKAHEDWLGYSSYEAIGQTLDAFVDDKDLLKNLYDAEETVLRTGEVVNIEVRGEHPKGHEFERVVTKFPIKSPDGVTESIGTFSVDVTERRRAEEALVRSEVRFRDFAESSADWFWETDEALRFTYLSPNVEQVVGVPPEWHYGKTREDLVGSDYDRDVWDSHLRTLKAHQPFRDFVYLYQRVGGDVEPKWLRTSGKPVFDTNGEFVGYRGTASDVTAFMESQARVETAEILMRDAINGIADSVILYDADERYILSNDKYLDFYPSVKASLKPRAKREDVARAIFESGDVRDAGQELEKWKLRRQNPSILSQELNEQQLTDGRWLFAQEYRTLTGNTVLVRTDITGLKEREIALRESEERFRALFDNSPVTILIKDTKGQYVTANRRWHDWFNPAGLDIKGKTAYDFYPRGHADEVNEVDRELIRSGKPVECEWQTPFPDGNTRLTLTQKFPILDHDGKITAIGSFNTDITERKQAEEAQRRSERRVADIFDASPAMIIVGDYTTGRFLEVNAAALSTLGYTLDEMLCETSLSLGLWKNEAQRDELLSILDRDNFIRNHEVVFRAKDGKEIPLLFSGAKIESEGNFQVLGVMSNIAEWKTLEDQLRQSQKMEAVGQLTGGLAHDFNNLLGVVIGNLDFLGEALADNQELSGLIAAATKAAVGGAELNKRLLAFSRTQPLAPKVVDLNAQVSDMLALLRRTLGEQILLTAIQNDTLWTCDVDPAQVESALLNLAINARDAMPEGGKLTIETANVRLDDDFAATQTEVTPGAYVRLTVTDTGRGMTPAVAAHVFEPFFTTKGVGEGSGLGLSMVFGFAKQSGGHVTVQSEEGVGTAVTIYLPRSKRLVLDEDEAFEVPNISSGTVLLVEDDPDFRTLAKTMLSSLGYKVLAAQDGRSALMAMDRAKRVDLLLTDVVLPGGMNGPTIAEAATKHQQDIKILFMSGYTQDAMAQRRQVGNDYQLLQKPFRKAELAKKIEAALDN